MLSTIMTQETPNPNALKFMLDQEVIANEEKITYKSAEECSHNPLAQKLFDVPNVIQVHFFQNVISITKSPTAEWEGVTEGVKKCIEENIDSHNAYFSLDTKAENTAGQTPDTIEINAILDRTIRPALQMDGGDLELLSYEKNTLTVNYQGACGGCPSSATGTLQAIEQILRDEFNPEISVIIDGM